MMRTFREGRESDKPLDKDMIDAWVMAIMKRHPDAAINICKVTRGEGGIPKHEEEKKSITSTIRQVLPLRNVNGKDGVYIKAKDLLRVGVPLPDGMDEKDVTRFLWIPFGEPSELDSQSYEGEAVATLAALDIADGCGYVLNKNFYGLPNNEVGQLHEFGAFVILGYQARLVNKTWGLSRGLQPQVTRSIMQNLSGIVWLTPPSREKQRTHQSYAVSTSAAAICNIDTLSELRKLFTSVSVQFLRRTEKASQKQIVLSASVIGDGRPVRALEHDGEVLTICVAPYIEGKSVGKPGDTLNQELLSAILGSKRAVNIQYIIFVGEELSLDSIVAIPITKDTVAKWLRVRDETACNLEMGIIYPMCSVDGVGEVSLCLYDEKEHRHLGQAGDVLNVDVLDKIRSRTIKMGGTMRGTSGVLSIFQSEEQARNHEPIGIAVSNEQAKKFVGGKKILNLLHADLLAGQLVTGTKDVGDVFTQEYNTLDGEYDPVVGALFPRTHTQNPVFAQRVLDRQEKDRKKAQEKNEKEERAKNKRLGIDTEEPVTSVVSKRPRRATRK